MAKFKLSRLRSSKKKPVSIVGRKRDYTYGENWRGFSSLVKDERGRRCQKCGSSKDLEDHHIIPLSKGGSNNRANIKVLCDKCHNKHH